MYQKTYNLGANETLANQKPMTGSESDHWVAIQGAATVSFYVPGQTTAVATVTSNSKVSQLGVSKITIIETAGSTAVVTISGK